MVTESAARWKSVRWARVGLFYGLALGWICVVTLGLYFSGSRDFSLGGTSQVAQLVIAALYMPAPLAAALVVERLDNRRPLIATTFRGFRQSLLPLVLVAVGVLVALFGGMIAASWLLGNVAGVSGTGTVLFSHEDLVANILLLFPGQDSTQVAQLSAAVPPFWGLVAAAGVSALIAGFTVNGLFAFGEEYGWRGWLADELRPLGALWANLITGVLWGLWHAPLILLGFNYYPYNRLGPAFMVVFCVSFSFVLWRAREVTGSLLAPAILHGMFNAFAGIFVFILSDRHPLLSAPVGLLGSAVIAVTAIGFWWLTRAQVAQRSHQT
ncbi:MAG: CPBP family intramembrane metalloprotease [Propionibacteriaceae bacterium]|nr:CPBP family intramembrane metalloprotease [Propionibacteriaceae bacterium]